MFQTAAIKPFMQNIFWSDEMILKKSLFGFFGVLIMVCAGLFSIPIQGTAAIFIGMLCGARLSTYIMITYLIFIAYTNGLAQFADPTGGYLIGLIPAAFISGYLTQLGCGRSVAGSFLAAGIGASIIFLFGITFLARFIGWPGALLFGLIPFVLSEFIKLIVIAFVIPKCWKSM